MSGIVRTQPDIASKSFNFAEALNHYYSGLSAEPSIIDDCFASAAETLARKAQTVFQTGRHCWVKKHLTRLTDSNNWHAYAMELSLCYELETSNKKVECGVKCIADDNSDVDIVYRHTNGVEVRAECVFVNISKNYWNEVQIASGLSAISSIHRNGSESAFSRIAQSKIRYKTIRKDGTPTKFPEADDNSAHLLICDVSKAIGHKPDYWDLQLLSLGRGAVHPLAQRNLLGLFESSNPYGADFVGEFRSNRFLRERIHGILFLIDDSIWRDALDPNYTCCVVRNPLLRMDDRQIEALNEFGKAFHGIMPRRMTGQQYVPTDANAEDIPA